MLDTPADTWYVWLGLAVASVLVTGTAFQLLDRTAGGAERVADAIDEVAASSYQAVERIPLDARAIRLASSRLSIRTRRGVAHASLVFGPIVPARDGRLGAVLRGRPVRAVFDDPVALQAALQARRTRTGTWRTAPESLTARRVSWGEVDATLVG
jgi:hypothetical protein